MQPDSPPRVLPYDYKHPTGSWVLKMHGHVRHPEQIVLSRSDASATTPSLGPLASMVRSLMITKHLLVVGASMTDDNFLRLAHEVLTLYESQSAPAIERREPEIGTVITLTDEPARAQLWRGRFDYIAASHAHNVPAQARDLAIFLDAVAMLSSEPSYLLDPRYADLLDGPAKAAAEHARRLLAEISSLGSPWKALAGHLHELGAP